jgi:hypothetical protein
MTNRYWEHEQPLILDIRKNVLRLFEKAGRLQVSMPNWTDKNGESKPGKTVTLNIDALRETSGGCLEDILRTICAVSRRI